MQEALAEAATTDASLAGLTLELSTTIFRTQGLDGTTLPVAAPAIVLSSSTAVIESTGFHNQEDAPGQYDVFAVIDNKEQSAANLPVTVNVELEKVGRDGEGGDLIIGGKDLDLNGDSDVDQVDGIAVFNIDVNGTNDQPSNLGVVRSTNQALDTVNISNGDDWDGADLTIRDLIGGGQELTLINATDFDGDFSLAMSDVTSQQALTSRFGSGDDKYDWMSVEDNGVSSDKDYSISMGSGDDTVIATLDGDSVDAIGESFALESGSGDDVIVINSVAGVSQETMYILDNMSIDSGSGADRVTINGYERFNINTEAGDDYVEITSVDPTDGNNGAWNVGADTGVQPFNDRVLYHAQLTVNFAGFESTVTVQTDAAGNFVADQTTINAAIIAAIEQSPVLTELLRDYDDVLQGLEYNLGTGNQSLQIISDIDGANELSIDLFQPTLVDADPGDGETPLSSSDLTAIRQGIIDTTGLTSADLEDATEIISEFNDGTTANLGDGSLDQTGDDISTDQFDYQFQAADADESADTTDEVNYSVINTGAGDDIVVLHSNDASANTLVFDSEFDDLTVVNFFDDAERNETGNHILDFTHYLDNEQDPSDAPDGNTQSVVDIAITYDGPETADAGDDLVGNELTVVKATFDDDHTFDGLTASNLLAAINDDDGSAEYANIDDNTLDAADSPYGDDFVGSEQDHIVFVENNENRGEYKIFHLTSELDADGNVDNDDGDFADATLLGTIDFGASITEDPLSMANLLGSEDPTGNGSTSWEDYYMNNVLTGNVPLPPVAVNDDDAFTVVQGESVVISSADLMANDTDPDTAANDLTIVSVAHFGTNDGTAVLADDGLSITFTAADDFEGPAYFTYTLSDGTLTDTAVVAGTVTAGSVNDPTEVAFTNGSSEDAAGDDFQYNVEMGPTDIFSGNITNFGDDDFINIDDAYLGTDNLLFDTTGTTEVNFAFGDMTDYTPSFTINMTGLDEALVASVEAAADSVAVMGILDTAWGDDWLI